VSVTGWLQGLEDRVERLETWAGPGQIEALAEGQRAIRADIAKLQVTVNRHEKLLVRIARDVGTLKTDVSTLKSDVSTLKSDVDTLKSDVSTLKGDVAVLKTDVVGLKQDMGEVKETLREILRRLPEHPSPN
jgi:chromosome segregation ATPase